MIVLGIDPSFNNTAVTVAEVSKSEADWVVQYLTGTVLSQKIDKKSKVRAGLQYADGFNRMKSYVVNYIDTYNPEYLFIELPGGSQSYSATMSNAASISLYAYMLYTYPHIKVYPLTPTDVKKEAGVDNLDPAATDKEKKQRVIDYVQANYPSLVLPTRVVKGVELINFTQANHIADAAVIVWTGLKKLPL